jgi:hypothetical protein
MAVVFVVLLSGFFGCTSGGSHNVVSVSESSPRISPELIALYREYSSRLAAQRKEPFRTSNVLVRIIDGRVLIDAVASGDVNALKADLVALGLREGVSFGRVVSGQLPISSILSLSDLASLRYARAAAATIQGTPLSSTRQIVRTTFSR